MFWLLAKLPLANEHHTFIIQPYNYLLKTADWLRKATKVAEKIQNRKNVRKGITSKYYVHHFSLSEIQTGSNPLLQTAFFLEKFSHSECFSLKNIAYIYVLFSGSERFLLMMHLTKRRHLDVILAEDILFF